MEDKEILNQKKVAYFSALVDAWVQSKMERDRTLVALSAAGIGVLVSLLSAIGVQHWWEIIFYGIGFLAFLLTMISCILIFDKNSVHIADVLREDKPEDLTLRKLDRLSMISFVIALVFSFIIATSTAINKLNEKFSYKPSLSGENTMSSEKSNVQFTINKSFDGIRNLNPSSDSIRSLNGIGNLNPDNSSASGTTNITQSNGNQGDANGQSANSGQSE